MIKYWILTVFVVLCISCTPNSKQNNSRSESQFSGKEGEVKLIILDPGHFHASLLLSVICNCSISTEYPYQLIVLQRICKFSCKTQLFENLCLKG